MTQPTRVANSSYLVVGGGAAGALTTARLLDESARHRVPMTVTLVESRPAAGQGVAYSTVDDRHILNLPAYKMSAYPEDGEHFLAWLDSRGRPAAPYSFVPRRWYGEYLSAVLDDSERRAGQATLRRVHARVGDLELHAGRCQVALDTGERIDADGVVLALGHLGIETAWAPEALVRSARFIRDPWAEGALEGLPEDGDALIIGTGLTMVDVFTTVARPDRAVYAISRHGVLPRRHADDILPGMEAPELPDSPGLAELRAALATHIAKARARYGDWRPAVDSIRAITQRLWAGLNNDERAEFVARDARTWDAMRHRIPPASAAFVAGARRAGRLVSHRAHVVAAVEVDGGIDVTLSDGQVLRVGAVLNCTGPCDRPQRSTDPFVRRLLERGLVRPGPLGIGFDTEPNGRVIDAAGSTDVPLWTLAALRKGSLWESTAMPEIREQAANVAGCLVRASERPGGVRAGGVCELMESDRRRADSRPRDQYDQPLSATAEAAEAWCRGLDSIRLVQAGAEEALSEAVRLDPGFAMGHAALALLGREWDAPVDVGGSLRAALDAIRLSGDARERSFVHMTLARLTEGRDAGDEQLLRHVNAYPRDCLAVSVALPTIAFSGLAGPLERAWALVERLAPAYGDDWWFNAILAFTRQEQERWGEADRLASRSMAAQPASGHAAHAQAHVFYETGAHLDGLTWLDGWIDAHGCETNHRAHYSWHAALHELALDDIDAVRRRYDAQLAPPAVTGARALVDSASLLWRLRILDAWGGDLPLDEMFTSIDACVFERPATPFAALHAVVGLALADDAAGIHRLHSYAARLGDPTFVEVVAPLCDGFAAVVEGRPGDAIEPLTRVSRSLQKLGGSAAQQEIVTETLIFALVRSGRGNAAREILSARLDRRWSPGDRRRLLTLGA